MKNQIKLNSWLTFDNGDEIFLCDSNGVRIKVIVEKNGEIVDFPGVTEEEIWASELGEGSTSPFVRYRTEFERCDNNRWRMLWKIQPDGRYWNDCDGFGGTSDSEIILYTYIDENGNFLSPFKVYSIGTQYFLEDR